MSRKELEDTDLEESKTRHEMVQRSVLRDKRHFANRRQLLFAQLFETLIALLGCLHTPAEPICLIRSQVDQDIPDFNSDRRRFAWVEPYMGIKRRPGLMGVGVAVVAGRRFGAGEIMVGDPFDDSPRVRPPGEILRPRVEAATDHEVDLRPSQKTNHLRCRRKPVGGCSGR